MLSIDRALLIAALALSGLPVPLQAQTPIGDPSRTITLVVPIAAGGGMDTIGRAVAEKLSERLKQPVVVENRTGAGGAVGVDYVAKAAPDGRTLLLMFANPTLPIADVKALIAHAKANPGKLSAGTPGIGSPHHLALAMLNVSAKIDLTHVPYRGTAPALNDLLGGQIPLIWATPNALVQFVEAGKVKPLAAASLERIAILPQVPTINESALPGFNVGVWFGIAAPAKTPREVTDRLAKEIGEITKLADVQKRLSALGYDLNFGDSERFRNLIATDHKRYGTVIREAGIAPN
jgi:tripartite-type tricarboxylate transporter receptor subunit TctC